MSGAANIYSCFFKKTGLFFIRRNSKLHTQLKDKSEGMTQLDDELKSVSSWLGDSSES